VRGASAAGHEAHGDNPVRATHASVERRQIELWPAVRFVIARIARVECILADLIEKARGHLEGAHVILLGHDIGEGAKMYVG